MMLSDFLRVFEDTSSSVFVYQTSTLSLSSGTFGGKGGIPLLKQTQKALLCLPIFASFILLVGEMQQHRT